MDLIIFFDVSICLKTLVIHWLQHKDFFFANLKNKQKWIYINSDYKVLINMNGMQASKGRCRYPDSEHSFVLCSNKWDYDCSWQGYSIAYRHLIMLIGLRENGGECSRRNFVFPSLQKRTPFHACKVSPATVSLIDVVTETMITFFSYMKWVVLR